MTTTTEAAHTAGCMTRTDNNQFQDSATGDIRLIRTRGKRWYVWTREPGNIFKRQHRHPITQIATAVQLANIFCNVREKARAND